MTTTITNRPLRTVRSFVRRLGRMTKAQQQALADYGDQYLVGQIPNSLIDPQDWFSARQPLVLEIGIGMGEHLLWQVSEHPAQNFIGIDVHEPGIGHCCRVLHERQAVNVRLCCQDAKEILEQLQDGVLDKIYILFPDPWHKKKHNKRRLIQADFVALLAQKLKHGGVVQLMTDWAEYAEQMQQLFQQSIWFEDAAARYPLRADRIITKFEQKGLKAGRNTHYLCFVRNASKHVQDILRTPLEAPTADQQKADGHCC